MMRGYNHEVCVLDSVFDGSLGWVPSPKYVWLANCEDGHYNMSMETPQEVDELIGRLEAAKHEAFPAGLSAAYASAHYARAWPAVHYTVTYK